MKKQLSGTAKSFSPGGGTSKKPDPFVIISWNVLSEELTEAVYNSITSSGTPLFSPTFQKSRIRFIKEKLEYYIRKYKHPIFCLQEVNDSHDPDKNLGVILGNLLKTHHYRVLYQSFGTFHPIYPELGLLTAIPLQHFDILDVGIKQMLPDFPNCVISVTVTPKTVMRPYDIVNTHFPAKFYDQKIMLKVSEAFRSLVDYSSRLIVCGDFNSNTTDSWYAKLKGSWKTLHPSNTDATSTISIQRRDKRAKTNQIFQGRIDHVFYHGSGLMVQFKEELPVSTEQSSLVVLPSNEIPSDHIPLVITFH
jgi:endonuclease/exonuclease/phosphatase family metal-dependent hydrolase